jgi:hypothetical protein
MGRGSCGMSVGWDYSALEEREWTVDDYRGTYDRREYLLVTQRGVQRCTDDGNPNYGGLSSSEAQDLDSFMLNGPAPYLLGSAGEIPAPVLTSIRAYIIKHRLAVLPPISVRVDGGGRTGSIFYTEGEHTAHFFWEFGGGEVVAIIDVPSREEWDRRLPWAARRRKATLERIAIEVCRQVCKGCPFRIEERAIVVLEPGKPAF